MKFIYWLLGVIIALGVISCIQTHLSTQRLISLLEKQQEIAMETQAHVAFLAKLFKDNEITEILLVDEDK